MRRGSKRLAARGAAEEVKSGMVVRRGGGLTGGPRTIVRVSVLAPRPKRMLWQHRGRKAPSHSSGRTVSGRANALGLRSHLYLDPAKPQIEIIEASFLRGAHSSAGKPDSCWRRLNILLSSSLANFSMGKALRRRSTISDAWAMIFATTMLFDVG